MRVCLVADGHSPLVKSWTGYLAERGHVVHIISSYPVSEAVDGVASMDVVPLGLSALGGVTTRTAHGASRSGLTRLLIQMRRGTAFNLATHAQYWLGSVEAVGKIGAIKDAVAAIDTPFVHAMRLPFEGIVAALAIHDRPVITSIWGNDLTLFAQRYPLVAVLTRRALKRASAVHCDCRRDLYLARQWGLEDGRPALVAPSGGGVNRAVFRPGEPDQALLRELDIPPGADAVINPRGQRAYVRNDIFFRSIPLILRDYPNTIFICTGMQDQVLANRWVRSLALEDHVRLLPVVPHERMADLFRIAKVAVSPAVHDGTPNTLLEAMACGCFPVAGDLESIREWIEDGVNGVLCDPTNPVSLAGAVSSALTEDALRQHALSINQHLINERAVSTEVMERVEDFYRQVATSGWKNA